jgi:para-nitrobenzyl esterase
MARLFVRMAFAGVALLVIDTAVAQITTATVTGGQVTGAVSAGVASFKGIPFAAPPVGELRWKAPQPVTAWSGTRQADHNGPSCMQDPTFARLFAAPPAIGEDCLYLNVWTPAKTRNDKLPVMVWIYGGGFVGGMTSVPAYDGTQLARKGVILVSVGYRLGVFGFLAHPDLTRESGKGSGNYGLLDQIAGLKWIKANIAAFGGDPARVTIFGESAGGISVSLLAASPRAKGLFRGVISESGGSLSPPRRGNEGGESVSTMEVAEVSGKAFLDKLGAHDLKAARALNADVIQRALGPGLQGGYFPVFDGDVLPGDVYLRYSKGQFNDTNVLIGTNSDEGGILGPRGGVTRAAFEGQVRQGYGAHADSILAAYPHATPADATRAAANLFRDSTFAWSTWSWARLQSEKGRGKAYLYYFDHRTARSPNGSSHGSEIGYVFGNLGGPGAGPAGIQGPPTAEDEQLSDLLSSYWVNFAKTGNPNGSGLPEWPAFSASKQDALVIDEHPGGRPVPNKPQLQALDSYYAWRRTGS